MKRKVLSFFFFFGLGFLALQIPFTPILGSRVKFTFFDFLAPTFGAFLGTPFGILAVFLLQVVNFFFQGLEKIETAYLLRLFPTLFAVSYFAKRKSLNFFFPLLAIVAFNLHPVGRSAWPYSLFWLIPPLAHFFRKNLFLRALGATFAAHSVGGALWVWTFGLTKEIWLSLIPQTAIERILMAGGISLSYLFFVKVLPSFSRWKLFSFLSFLTNLSSSN